MNENIIRCPHCGAEYLPAEIYLPNDFLGKQTDIVKDSFGKIECCSGKQQDLKEVYNCDYCHKDFSVFADIQYTVEDCEFYTEFVQKIK